MRPFPMTVLRGGIDRLRVKGGATADRLYDLQNGYITNAGSISPREGTIRAATLDSSTVGLAAADGQFNIFSSAYSTASLPSGYVLNVLSNPNNTSASPTKIWFAKPFMGFPYVVAQFSDSSIFHYWLQNDGVWTSSTDYTSASIVLPPVANGLAYQGVRDFPVQPLWTANTTIASGSYIEPNTPTGFAYQAVLVTGSPVHTSEVEPVWPTVAGGIVQEFGDFDVSTSDAGTTQANNSNLSTASPLGSNITDRYGNSSTIANSGVFATSAAILPALASTKITTWKSGTNYAPGAVVVPTSNQGAFVNAIPNGDFEGGSGAGGWTFTDPGGAGQWAYSATLAYQGTECITLAGGTSLGSQGAFATMTSFGLVTPGQSVTGSAYVNPNNSGANLTIWIQLNWYDNTDTLISTTGNQQNEQEGGGYRQIFVTGTAPAGAAHVRVAIGAGSGTTSRNAGFVDLVSWNLETPARITNFLFEAIQPAAGSSAATEPTWPTTLNQTVIDGGVTWKAIGTSIITWQAIPLMQSGLVAPTFPIVIGNFTHDYSTYSNQNGYITTFCSMSWECVDRHIADPKCPNTKAVTIGASHVFAGDNDICDYSAAVDPTDWTSTNNAGYLPTGLNNYGDNPVAMLALYRSNLMVFNASGYQMWQIDPDPQNMALLDAQPIGSIWPRAAQSVANDLLFLTEVGVRNLGIVGATANLQIGNTGQPVDPLIKEQLSGASMSVGGGAGGGAANVDQFFANVSLLLPFNGVGGGTSTTDVSPIVNVMTVNAPCVLTTVNQAFPNALSMSGGGSSAGYVTTPVTAAGPLDLSTGDFTIELSVYINAPHAYGQPLLSAGDNTGSAGYGIILNGTSVGPTFTFGTHFVNNPIVLPIGAWSNLAVVRKGNLFDIFVNGVPNSGGPVTVAGSIGRISPLYIGAAPNFAGAGFDGLISQVRITKGIARAIPGVVYIPPLPFPVSALYDPLSLYYPGRGQYWLIFGPQAFVLTINGNSQKTWSRYIFPDTITDWTLNQSILYLRTAGNLVWQFDANTLVDDANTTIASATNIPFNGVVQWPYMDMGSLGFNKMLIGVDIVGDGNCSIQVGFNQADKTTLNDNTGFVTSTGVTTPYLVAVDDTVPGEPLPIPVMAPSYSLILTFTGSSSSPNAWSWEAANLYIADARGGGATG